MIPELGQFSLILALCLAVAQATVPLVGAAQGRIDWMALARPAAAEIATPETTREMRITRCRRVGVMELA